jgi:Uncharacterised nucleotidyltransferase
MHRAAVRVWLDRVAAQTVTALRARGVRPILLKGPPIARWLYADAPTERFYEDVDLLVGPSELRDAEAVLGELEFQRRTVMLADDPEPHAEPFVRASDGATVDLHRTLHRCEHVADALVWGVVSSDTERMVVGGAEVEVPSVPVRLLHVTFHPDPTKHPPGARPWIDLERAIEQVDMSDWYRAKAIAQELGTSDAMGYGLRLVPRGAELADRLGLPRNAPESAILRESSTSTRFVAQLAALPSVRAKARYVTQKLFPPRAYMEQSTELARRGGASLGIAYAARLGRAVVQLPGAVAGWWRVQRVRQEGRRPG